MLGKGALLKKIAFLGVGVLVVAGGGVGYAATSMEQPQVKNVNAQWGEVTDEQTHVETSVTVDNPNDVAVPGVVGLTYTTTLNDVVIMEGRKSSVGLSPGTNEIAIPATMENDAIAEWWVTHINNGEQSEMKVEARVEGPGGVGKSIPVRQSTVETDMLAPMRTDEPTTVELQGEEFIVLKEQSASWGEATMEETPIQFSATVENRHEYPLTLDGLGYEVRMNDVTVGEGRTTEGVSVEPGETGTISVDAAIDTPKMADWWASHVRNNESTRMSVAMYGLVERDGELVRVPIELFQKELRFETDMLGGGATQVQAVEASNEEPSYEQPTVVDSDREWGQVTDETTSIRTTVTVDNPNEGRMNEFVSMSVGQRVAINDVIVADGSSDVGTLEPGTNGLQTSVHLDNSKVPEWWARHVNNGERSTLVMQPRTAADLGFTKFGFDLPEQRTTMETDLIAGLNNDRTQEIRSNGRKVAEVKQTRASWSEADTETSPIEVTVTVENTAPVPLTLEDLQYTVTMNDVTAGDGTAPESYTIDPGRTRELTFTVVVDSQKMDEWWVSHVRNGEETSVDVDASIRASAGGESDRVAVDGLTDSQTVRTNLLGDEEE